MEHTSQTIQLARLEEHIGKRIRRRRRQLHLTQRQLGKRVGICFQQIQNYEVGHGSISARRLYEVAQALEATPELFYQGFSD